MYFNKQVFLERLVTLRKESKFTQIDLAQQLNVSKGAIAHWEKGSRFPNMEVINDLALIFHCTPAYLLGLSNIKDNQVPDTLGNFFYNTSAAAYIAELTHQNQIKFIAVNKAALVTLGYTEPEFLRLEPTKLCPHFYYYVQHNNNFSLKSFHIKKNGKYLPVDMDVYFFLSNTQSLSLTLSRYL